MQNGVSGIAPTTNEQDGAYGAAGVLHSRYVGIICQATSHPSPRHRHRSLVSLRSCYPSLPFRRRRPESFPRARAIIETLGPALAWSPQLRRRTAPAGKWSAYTDSTCLSCLASSNCGCDIVVAAFPPAATSRRFIFLRLQLPDFGGRGWTAWSDF